MRRNALVTGAGFIGVRTRQASGRRGRQHLNVDAPTYAAGLSQVLRRIGSVSV